MIVLLMLVKLWLQDVRWKIFQGHLIQIFMTFLFADSVLCRSIGDKESRDKTRKCSKGSGLFYSDKNGVSCICNAGNHKIPPCCAQDLLLGI